jgi:hypothetical protein
VCMVAHQHIRVNCAARVLARVAKRAEVEGVVLGRGEARCAVVATLDDVERLAGGYISLASRQDEVLSGVEGSMQVRMRSEMVSGRRMGDIEWRPAPSIRGRL